MVQFLDFIHFTVLKADNKEAELVYLSHQLKSKGCLRRGKEFNKSNEEMRIILTQWTILMKCC